jgi:sulfoxide reductase heme-binding subunit YedZ
VPPSVLTKPWFGLGKQPPFFSALLFIASLAPLVLVPAALWSDFVRGTSFLGAEPVTEMEHMIGEWGLRFLYGTLLVTPLRDLTGWNWLAKHRRTLGLFAFAAICLHLLTWVFLDLQVGLSDLVGWADVGADLAKRPYLTIGMLGFVLMIPLAWTSTKAAIRRMGKRWNRLHRLTYVIPVLGVIHYAMAQKKDIEEPLMYAAFLGGVLLWRYWIARKRADAHAPAAA